MGKYREIKASLKHKTPLWRQARMISGHPVGCGAAAWAIVYGYWNAYRGKTKLFNGYDILHNNHVEDTNDPEIKSVMGKIAQYIGTDYGDIGGQYGMTAPRKMPRGVKYAKKMGYSKTSCTRWRGGEFPKFSEVKKNLDKDRPVILLIHADGFGIANHYVVIEKAVKKQKRVLGKWRDRDVRYYVNFGNGSRKWIYVREKGVNDHKVYSSFSAYFINVA